MGMRGVSARGGGSSPLCRVNLSVTLAQPTRRETSDTCAAKPLAPPAPGSPVGRVTNRAPKRLPWRDRILGGVRQGGGRGQCVCGVGGVNGERESQRRSHVCALFFMSQ